MKKILVMMVFVFAMMFVGVNEAKATADCPEGFNSTSRTFTVNGCDYEILVCYNCETDLTVDQRSIRLWGIRKLDDCPQSWDINQVHEDLTLKIMTNAFLYEICPLDPKIKPCEDPGPEYYTFVLYQTNCWYKFNDYGEVWYLPCPEGDNYCVTQYKVCYDPNLQEYVYTIIYGPFLSTYYDCPEGAEPDDPALGEETDCFAISNKCNPNP
jgi:hypothetical protein